jgi:hypothetical protein
MSIFDDITGLAHKIEDAVKHEAEKLAPEAETYVESVGTEIATDYHAVAAKLAAALKDVLPASWPATHPSADLFATAKAALDAFEAKYKI